VRGSDGSVTAGSCVVTGTEAVVARLSSNTGRAVLTKTTLFTAAAAAAAARRGADAALCYRRLAVTTSVSRPTLTRTCSLLHARTQTRLQSYSEMNKWATLLS